MADTGSRGSCAHACTCDHSRGSADPIADECTPPNHTTPRKKGNKKRGRTTTTTPRRTTRTKRHGQKKDERAPTHAHASSCLGSALPERAVMVRTALQYKDHNPTTKTTRTAEGTATRTAIHQHHQDSPGNHHKDSNPPPNTTAPPPPRRKPRLALT